MKQIDIDTDFREYDARKGELNDDLIAWKTFESNNIPIEVPWSFAIITDLHIGRGYPDYGEEGWDDTGTTLKDCQEYYLTQRLEKVVETIINLKKDKHKNLRFVAVLGDISDSGEYSELEKAKHILDDLNLDLDNDGKLDLVSCNSYNLTDKSAMLLLVQVINCKDMTVTIH